MPISLDGIRSINTLSFIASGEITTLTEQGTRPTLAEGNSMFPGVSQGFGAVKVFEAECPSGLQIVSQAITENFGSDIVSKGLSIVANFTGYTPAFDYPRKFIYKGSAPLKFNLQCVLRLKQDPIIDFVNPLRCLMALYLPSRDRFEAGTDPTSLAGIAKAAYAKKAGVTVESLTGKNISLTEGGDYLLDDLREGWNKVTTSTEWIQKAAKFVGIDPTLDSLVNMFGDVYPLTIPFPFKPMDSKKSSLTMRIGRLRIEGVIITGATLNVPFLMYEEGYPDHITINLQVETLRVATTDLYKDLFDALQPDGSTFTAEQFREQSGMSAPPPNFLQTPTESKESLFPPDAPTP